MPIGFHVSLNEYFLGHQWKMSESVTAVQSPLHGYRFSVVMFDVQAAFAALCQEAVFDRFPQLKVLLLETGGGWIAHFLERMDAKHKLLRWKTGLKHYPSEYFRRQCWISFDPDETTIPAMVKHCGANTFIWVSDFPHFDASPAAVEETNAAISALTPSEQRLILATTSHTSINYRSPPGHGRSWSRRLVSHLAEVHLYLSSQKDWVRRVVTLKIITNDSATTMVTGPGLRGPPSTGSGPAPATKQSFGDRAASSSP